MLVERTKDEVILRLPADTDIQSLQKILNFLRYKSAIKDSKATEKDASELAKETKSGWWKDNKERFVK